MYFGLGVKSSLVVVGSVWVFFCLKSVCHFVVSSAGSFLFLSLSLSFYLSVLEYLCRLIGDSIGTIHVTISATSILGVPVGKPLS